MIGAFKWLGMPLVAMVLFLALVLASWFGQIAATTAAFFGGIKGIIFGFGLALRFIDYAITYEPDVFIKQYRDMKGDGRWEAMVAELRAKRTARGR